MATTTTTRTKSPTRSAARSHEPRPADFTTDKPSTPDVSPDSGDGRYVIPLIHTSVPSKVVNLGFWGALLGTVAVGAVDPPLGLLIGAGVVIARHRPATNPS